MSSIKSLPFYFPLTLSLSLTYLYQVGVTTAKVIMGSLHLHFPHLKLLNMHCPVGDGAVPGLYWLFNRRIRQSEHDRFLLLLLHTFSNSSLLPSYFTAMLNYTVSRCFWIVDAIPTSFGRLPLCRLLWHTRRCPWLSLALLFVDS